MMKRKSQSEHHDRIENTMHVSPRGLGGNGRLRYGVSPQSRSAFDESPQSPAEESGIQVTSRPVTTEWTSVTTRKSKACASCRKQKIKCIVDGDSPPCRRCKQRGLGCVQDKTLQSVVDDQASWKRDIQRQIAQLYSALNETRTSLSQPTVPSPNNGFSFGAGQDEVDSDPKNADAEMDDDDDGRLTPESLSSAPIDSLYEVTRLKSLRTGDSTNNITAGWSTKSVIQPDFISRGVISLDDAERLAKLYMSRLDHYFYGHLERYTDLSSVRQSSTMLAACICTVAALHDPASSNLYDKCLQELRTVVSASMFTPRLGLEDIRALCIGSYWLCEISWILSGYGIRKAITLQLYNPHIKQPCTNPDDFLRSQLWLLLYICDQQISILHGLPPMMADKESIMWEQHVASSFATDADLRCVSHIDLLLILGRIRDLYGSDMTKPIVPLFTSQLRHFNLQIDKWGATWSGKLAPNKHLGNFPSHAVTLHYHFAKFYLCSHVYRGLRTTGQADGATLSRELKDMAEEAITAAFSILQSLLDYEELRIGLVGVPHYFHTMYAFAAVFLLKIATRYTEHVAVDVDSVLETVHKIVYLFETSPCARQHLVHRISRGLKEMLIVCRQLVKSGVENSKPWEVSGTAGAAGNGMGFRDNGGGIPDDTSIFDLENFDFLSTLPPSWPS